MLRKKVAHIWGNNCMPIASCKWEAFPFFENREDCHGRRGALPSELGALWLYSLPYEITSSLPGPMPFCVLVSHTREMYPLLGPSSGRMTSLQFGDPRMLTQSFT